MRISFISLFLLISLAGLSQDIRYTYVARPDSVLNILVSEREGLYQQWSDNQKERNAFFGGQSKNDLRTIIETLEKILRKDNEILSELNRMKQAEVTDLRRKNSDVSQKVNSYIGESGQLMEENKQLRAQLTQARKNLTVEEEDNHLPFQVALAALVVSWIGFYFWRKKK